MPKELNQNQIEKLKKNLKMDSGDLLIRVLLRTGMRSAELYALKQKDIHNNKVKVTACKGSLNRDMPLGDLTGPLRALLSHLGDDLGNLWGCTSRNSFTAALRRFWALRRLHILGFEGGAFGLHSLRATAAMNVYRMTKDPMAVKAFLGHKSISSVIHYIHAVESESWSKMVI